MSTDLEKREKELWRKLEIASYMLYDAAEDLCQHGHAGWQRQIKDLRVLKKRIAHFDHSLAEWGIVKTQLETKKEETT